MPGGPAKMRAPVAASREDPLLPQLEVIFRLDSREGPAHEGNWVEGSRFGRDSIAK